MSNSPLVSYTKLSPNHSSRRIRPVERITPHCIVGQISVEALGDIFSPKAKRASSNYGIGKDGRVGMYVEEANRSWCSNSSDNDQRAVTIECASDATPPYAFTDVVYQRLIELCVDICRRNGKKKLLWIEDKGKALKYNPAPDEMLLTVHRWFSKKSCPGDWMFARMGELAEKVTRELASSSEASSSPTASPGSTSAGTTKKTAIENDENDKNNEQLNNNPVPKLTFYRVRKSWDKPNTQIAAFTKIDNAKNCVDCKPKYSVFDEDGNKIYPTGR